MLGKLCIVDIDRRGLKTSLKAAVAQLLTSLKDEGLNMIEMCRPAGRGLLYMLWRQPGGEWP